MFGCPVEPHQDFSHVSKIVSNLFLTDEVACVCVCVCGEGEGRGRANKEEIDLP